MNPVRILIIVIAAIAAIGLAFVMRGVFGAQTPAPVAAAPDKPTNRVLIAKRDLPVGYRLTANDIGWQEWPAEGLNPTFITDGAPATTEAEKPKGVEKAAATAGEIIGGGSGGTLQTWVGALVREPMLNGEPLTARKLVREGEGGFMSVVLSPGKRALSIPVTVETAAGGFILPGDRVDVLVAREMKPRGREDEAVDAVPDTLVASEILLTNVRVLAIDQTVEAQKDTKSLIGSTATLEVGADEGEILTKAKGEGTLVLALRPLEESGAYSGAVRRKAAQSDTSMIRINRGGKIQTVGASQ